MRYRTIAIPVVGVVLVLAGYLVFGNLNQNLVYYLTPAEAMSQKTTIPEDQRFRLGGLVQEGSVVTTETGVDFMLVDGEAVVPVRYQGAPSQLFAAGIGAVVEGSWRGDTFYADNLIVKHDQNYKAPASATEPTGSGGRP